MTEKVGSLLLLAEDGRLGFHRLDENTNTRMGELIR